MNTPAKFRKKPVVIEAIQFNALSLEEVKRFVGGGRATESGAFLIETLEGTMRADYKDWIIKGVAGEFYPCKPEIFAATYEPVGSES